MRHLQVNRYCRLLPDHLKGVFNQGELPGDEDTLWINARFLPSGKLLDAIRQLKTGEQLSFKGDVVAAVASPETSDLIHQTGHFLADAFKNRDISDLIHLEYLWDMLALNGYEIEKDLPLTNLKPVSETGFGQNATITQPDNVFIDESAVIEPRCTFLGNEGPVIIREGAHIETGSILRGPVVIDKNATVKMQARIFEGTTVGPVCKVGGEVSNCIFHSYSNKAHDGYTGNSIFGQWVNLGAGTNISNLKNNYSSVRIADWDSREEIETNMLFLGTIMGDHSKTAIGTVLNTGTICGVSANIFMNGFPPKYIPSFSWVGSEDFGIYQFDKALQAMQAMMKRRDVNLGDDYNSMMRHLYNER